MAPRWPCGSPAAANRSVDGDVLALHRLRALVKQFIDKLRAVGAHEAQKGERLVGRPAERKTHVVQFRANQRKVAPVIEDDAVAQLAVDELVVVQRDVGLEYLPFKFHVAPRKCGHLRGSLRDHRAASIASISRMDCSIWPPQ